MVISVLGLISQVVLNFIDRICDMQMNMFCNEVQYNCVVSVFCEWIVFIILFEELVKDFEVYSFVMNVFDFEDQIFGCGMMCKILESDLSDDIVLVNWFLDVWFGEIYDVFGFILFGGG